METKRCKLHKELSELQAEYAAAEKSLREAVLQCRGDTSILDQKIADGTTTVQWLQDASETVKLAQKALDQTTAKLKTLKDEADAFQDDLDKVLDGACLHVP